MKNAIAIIIDELNNIKGNKSGTPSINFALRNNGLDVRIEYIDNLTERVTNVYAKDFFCNNTIFSGQVDIEFTEQDYQVAKSKLLSNIYLNKGKCNEIWIN